eukprot:scaffold351273_cov18-Prasinocladus_malaysianus.AAC.1
MKPSLDENRSCTCEYEVSSRTDDSDSVIIRLAQRLCHLSKTNCVLALTAAKRQRDQKGSMPEHSNVKHNH